VVLTSIETQASKEHTSEETRASVKDAKGTTRQPELASEIKT
jgi:hypothetical protein